MAKKENIIPLKISFLVFTAIFMFFYLSNIQSNYISDADASRIVINGIFLKDFILSGDYSSPVQYATEYFAQYPSLAIAYWPPLFHILEAILFLVFGNILMPIKFLMLGFSILLFVMNYKLMKKLFNSEVAFFSTCFLMLSASIINFSQVILNDVPVAAMTVFVVYLFYCYFENPTNKNLTNMLIVAFLALLLKETSMVIVPGLILFLLIYSRKHLVQIFKEWRKLALISCFIIISSIWLYIRYSIYPQALGAIGGEFVSISYFSPERWFFYYNKLFYQTSIIIPILFSLYILLWLFQVKKTTKQENLLLMLFFAAYIILSLSGIWHMRYSLFLLVPVCGIATVFVYRIIYFFMKFTKAKSYKMLFFSKVGLSALMVFLFIFAYFVHGAEIKGHDKAAKYVVDNYEKNSVLFSGAGNSEFILYVRLYDKEMKNVILRDTVSFTYFPNYYLTYGEKKIIETKEDTKKLIDDYSVKYVVIEDRNLYNITSYELISDLVDDGDFLLVKSIPVETNSPDFKKLNILIYEYRDFWKIRKPEVDVYLPFLNSTVNIKFK